MDMDKELRLFCVTEALQGADLSFRRARNTIRRALEEIGTVDPSKLETEEFWRLEEKLAHLLVWQAAHEKAVQQWIVHHARIRYGAVSPETSLVALRDLFSELILPWIGEEIAHAQKAAPKSAEARAKKAANRKKAQKGSSPR
jgi:hypothetical protein